ncbi:ligase-associated DNA damage response DEXH box helicase [Membranihabitans maritimus]|uniref:ligase-associated DNA damage response DEXH box helicase n=1 Tax=Membranihabitans maritimus TaxID=2904244 RepID=UPI001F023ACA|nr:ligase-associated DNA damage response DEXH box helicase [Membranihabitans maritimus]
MSNFSNEGLERIKSWFSTKGWKPQDFQLKAWKAHLKGKSGLVGAPTGYGKTMSIMVPAVLTGAKGGAVESVSVLWISPVRALTKDIARSAEMVCKEFAPDWSVFIRTGDTGTSARNNFKKEPAQILVTTPESFHLLLTDPAYITIFMKLQTIVIDEWHDLMGSKRGVQVQLALSRILSWKSDIKVWGISATLADMQMASEVLFGTLIQQKNIEIVTSNQVKSIEFQTVLPDDIHKMPWAGHLGLYYLGKVIDLILQHNTTLIFTNTRSQCEIWYKRIIEHQPELSGVLAMHHGSVDASIRNWVEQAIHDNKMKAIVATSSLDMGVDFAPVDSIIQIGSPKGVARFIQRAGRSGHRPGATSNIYFIPTHLLEIIEGAALREALEVGIMEEKLPYIRSFDVLIQYLMTIASSTGFEERKLYSEIVKTFAFSSISRGEWNWCLEFLTTGGTMEAYENYRKIGLDKNGLYRIANSKVKREHKMGIGTIVGDEMLLVKYIRGPKIGNIEEWFISRLNPGDHFWFAGKLLKYISEKNGKVLVRKGNKPSNNIPSWLGGRIPLSSPLSSKLRNQIYKMAGGVFDKDELKAIEPAIKQQTLQSYLPSRREFLIEYIQDNEGFHLLFYPFEGRLVHEGMAILVAKRISFQTEVTFSIAMNDYGFELLSEKEIDIGAFVNKKLFTTEKLWEDIQNSLNTAEMARKKFRDIATISGLLFQGFPNRRKQTSHLQTSAGLLYEVFKTYDPDNLLFLQSLEEVLTFQLEENRLRESLNNIVGKNWQITRPEKHTPFSFPILVDRLREHISSEQLQKRIQRMDVEWKS